MRKWFVLLLIALLIIPAASFARQDELLFPLDGTFTEMDAGFTFPYPSEWVWEANNGVYFAENDDDLAATVDDDPETVAEGPTLHLLAVPLEQLDADEDTALDDLVTTVVEITGWEVSEQFDLAITGRRSTTLVGVGSDGRGYLNNLWTQNGYLIIFGLATVDDPVDYAYTWGNLIGGITTVEPETLNGSLESDYFNIGISYPRGWEAIDDPSLVGLFEQESDLEIVASGSGDIIEGLSVTILTQPLTDLGLDGDASPALVGAQLEEAFGLSRMQMEGEFLVKENRGVGFSGRAENGRQLFIVVTVNADAAFEMYALSTPDRDALDAFKPTFLMMLHSITPL